MWTFLGLKALGGGGNTKLVDNMLPNFFPNQQQQLQQQQNVGKEAENNGIRELLFGDILPTQQQQNNNSNNFFGQQQQLIVSNPTDFLVPQFQQITPPLQVITIILQYGPLKEMVVVERTVDPSAFEMFRLEFELIPF